MKHSVLIVFCFLMILCSREAKAQSATNAECASVRTGEFVDAMGTDVLIVRDSSTQTETDPASGLIATYRVDWIDSCTYTLTYISSNSRKYKRAAKKMGVIRIAIIYVDEEGYRYSATAPGMLVPFRGSLKRKT